MDVGAIVSRLSVIRQCVNALRAMQHLEYDAFAQDRLTLTSAEHELQIAIQAALDIGLILLSEQPVRAPAEYREIFRDWPRQGFFRGNSVTDWPRWRGSATCSCTSMLTSMQSRFSRSSSKTWTISIRSPST